MDNQKIGQLITSRRREQQMTQKMLAQKLMVSEQAVSKWERGLGCPDISILQQIAEELNLPVETLLNGDITKNQIGNGNMMKLNFYQCMECGNMITSTGELNAGCCGKRLVKEEAQMEEASHPITIELIDGDYYVSVSHPMTKQHYITMIAYVTVDKYNIQKLYPEQNAQASFRKAGRGMIYIYCNQDGLFGKRI